MEWTAPSVASGGVLIAGGDTWPMVLKASVAQPRTGARGSVFLPGRVWTPGTSRTSTLLLNFHLGFPLDCVLPLAGRQAQAEDVAVAFVSRPRLGVVSFR